MSSSSHDIGITHQLPPCSFTPFYAFRNQNTHFWAILQLQSPSKPPFFLIFRRIDQKKVFNWPNNLFTTSESPNIRIPILQIFVFIYWRGTKKHFYWSKIFLMSWTSYNSSDSIIPAQTNKPLKKQSAKILSMYTIV